MQSFKSIEVLDLFRIKKILSMKNPYTCTVICLSLIGIYKVIAYMHYFILNRKINYNLKE